MITPFLSIYGRFHRVHTHFHCHFSPEIFSLYLPGLDIRQYSRWRLMYGWKCRCDIDNKNLLAFHFHVLWCCEMSKIKRRVTVDSAKSVTDEGDRRKPSVFERLGPGARKQLDDVKRKC